jgi:hypothetical protein
VRLGHSGQVPQPALQARLLLLLRLQLTTLGLLLGEQLVCSPSDAHESATHATRTSMASALLEADAPTGLRVVVWMGQQHDTVLQAGLSVCMQRDPVRCVCQPPLGTVMRTLLAWPGQLP